MKDEGLRMMNLDNATNIKMLLNDWSYPIDMNDLEDNVKSYINVVAGFEPWTNREMDMFREFKIWQIIVEHLFG